jgi:uncharacterized protein (TIGR02679 family)
MEAKYMSNRQDEAVKYFKQEPGFHRLLDQFIEKYRGLGRMGGSAKLSKLAIYEKEALSSLFRKDYSRQNSAAISLTQFVSALAKTRYAGVDIKQLLDGYAGYNIETRVEEKVAAETNWKVFIEDLLNRFEHPDCQLWLKHILSKGTKTRGIYQEYVTHPEGLRNQLERVLGAISQFPKPHYERLPVFAQRITKNPHSFDNDQEEGRFLLTAMQFLRKCMDDAYVIHPTLSAEELSELFHHFGLIRDDLMNFVTCAGILGFRQGRIEPLPMWLEAWKDGCVMNIPLRELIRISECKPAHTLFQHKPNIVYVIENSGVFSSLVDALLIEVDSLPPMICTQGQFKLATWVLIDKLIANKASIYYAGDFDPEGLLMAQRLIQRYPDYVQPWRYQNSDYERCISDESISNDRLKQLNAITVPSLLPVRDAIYQMGKSGYQEEIIADMLSDMIMNYCLSSKKNCSGTPLSQ